MGDLHQILGEIFGDQKNMTDQRKHDNPNPTALTQYITVGGGYMPASSTVATLPDGVYEITSTQQGTIAKPVIVKDNLLLELPEMRSEHVLTLIDRFWASEKDYKEGNEFVHGGALFKVGVMLFGKPGTGKTCTIKLLSKKIVAQGGVVFLGNTAGPSTVSGFLRQFAEIEPDRKIIVVLEDFDSLIDAFGEDEYLQMLDGTASIDNVLFIVTTNYPEKLDPRIYNRPGRLTHIVKVDLPSAAARQAYLKAILKRHDHVEHIVANTEGFSVDHLSALVNAVYREGKTLDEEIKRLRKMFVPPKADNGGGPMGFGVHG